MNFPDLYRAQFAYAWKTLRRMGVQERDLPDLTHDLFVVVFRVLNQFDESRPVRPWLCGIAFRVASSYRRSARFTREVLTDGPRAEDRQPAADEQLAAAQARALLMGALDGLELERRAVFVMHDLDEQPVPQIAAALEIPLATAYSRLRLAREDVAAAVKRLRAREDRAT